MPPNIETLEAPTIPAVVHAVAEEVRRGLASTPKALSPWLFYDEVGSRLFEQITALPEYYLSRTERDLFATYADEIFLRLNANLVVVELGAGTAAKTGILLRALTRIQPRVLYQPIDISPSALDEARSSLEHAISGVAVRPCVANYVAEPIRIVRQPQSKVLALYIGSSIGNFSPMEAREILTRLRCQLRPEDALLLGADLAPSLIANGTGKSVAKLLAAYDDAQGITAAFNRNVLVRLNRELGANFQTERFAHRALWNPTHSRIEMHLESLVAQSVSIPANTAGSPLSIPFAQGETIHTENSYKFTNEGLASLLTDSGFKPVRTFTDPQDLFAVTLAEAF